MYNDRNDLIKLIGEKFGVDMTQFILKEKDEDSGEYVDIDVTT